MINDFKLNIDCPEETSADELFQKTKDLFCFIEEQKKLQLEIIGLVKGIDEHCETNSRESDLKKAIESLTCELRKSNQCQKIIEHSLKDCIDQFKFSTGKKGSENLTNNQNKNCDKTFGTNNLQDIPIISNIKSPTVMSDESEVGEENKSNIQRQTKFKKNINTPPPISEPIYSPNCDELISMASLKPDCNDEESNTNYKFTTLRHDFCTISKPSIFICVFDDLQNIYQNEIENWSEPFYTSHIGYRMKVKLGFSSEYIGIYLKMIEGDFDDLLAWPFRNEISFSLLNQVDEKCNLTRLLKPHPNDCDEYGYWLKPKTVKCAVSGFPGWGLNDFVERKQILGPNDDFVSDFVRNNRIYIKVKII